VFKHTSKKQILKNQCPRLVSAKAGTGTAGDYYKSAYLSGDLLVLVAPGKPSFFLA
jgi:hypothetical protein